VRNRSGYLVAVFPQRQNGNRFAHAEKSGNFWFALLGASAP
jgi:hypothetical protein